MRAALAIASLLAWFPASASGVPATFTGTLRLVLGFDADNTVFDVTVSGSGQAEMTLAGGLIDSADVQGGAFTFATGPIAVTDPDLFPVTSIDVQATSGPGAFTGLASGGGGTLLVDGAFGVGLLGDPIDPLTAFLLSQGGVGVGAGGIVAPAGGGGLRPILFAAPWSVGTVTSGPVTISGSTSADRIVLVTPFRYESTSFNTAFGYAVLDLELTEIPEPGTLALVAGGVAIVAALRRRG